MFERHLSSATRDRKAPTAAGAAADLGLPVLAVVPVMLTAAERRRRRRGWAVVAMSVPCLAALAWLTFR